MLKIIAIGCDHAGYSYKTLISKHLKSKKYKVLDKGAYSSESVDYPDFAVSHFQIDSNKIIELTRMT